MVNSLGAGAFTALTINFIPVVARRLDADPLLLSIILAAPFAGSVLNVFSGYWLPRHNRLRFAAVAIGFARGLLFLTPLATGPLSFTLLAVLLYLLIAVPNPIFMEVLRGMYPAEKRARLLSITRIGMTAAITVGSLVGGSMLDNWGPAVLFPLGALLGLVSAGAYSRIRVQEVEVQRFGTSAAFGLLREDRAFAAYTFAMILWGFGLFMFGPFQPLMLVDRLHASYTEVGVLGFVSSAFWLLSYFYWGRSVDRLGATRVMAISHLLTVLTPLLYWLSPSVWLLVPAAAAMGIANGGIDLAGINAILRLAPPSQVPRYTALINTLLGFRGMVAPFVGSALAAQAWFGFDGVAILCILFICAGATLMRTVALEPVIAPPIRTPPVSSD